MLFSPSYRTWYPIPTHLGSVAAFRPLVHAEAQPADCAEEGAHVALLVMREGAASFSIPELGARQVVAGEWCVLSDLGPTSKIRFSEAAGGFGARLHLPDSTQGSGATSLRLPAKIHCLICPSRSSAFFVKGSCCGRLSQLAQSLCSESPDSLSGLWSQESAFAEFMARLLERPELQADTGCRPCCCERDVETVEKIARHLQDSLDEAHSIPALSRQFFLNECKLKQSFKAHYGCTVFNYLRRVRMERARELLLQDRETTVLEVANAVGYSNPSHFARAFREVHAINPGEIREGAYQSALSRT